MTRMCIVNKDVEIGLIVYTTYNLQLQFIYLGER